jgi:hypothetical protein
MLVTVNVVPISLIFVTLMIKTILSSETSIIRLATQAHITEDGIILYHITVNIS